MNRLLTLPDFIPNNEISGARKLRIQRAREYGAAWARGWQDNITHVVCDRNWSYDQVLSYLEFSTIPVSG